MTRRNAAEVADAAVPEAVTAPAVETGINDGVIAAVTEQRYAYYVGGRLVETNNVASIPDDVLFRGQGRDELFAKYFEK